MVELVVTIFDKLRNINFVNLRRVVNISNHFGFVTEFVNNAGLSSFAVFTFFYTLVK